jgi:hypothetical protein
MSKIFGMNEGELLLLGITGFYIARGINKATNLPAEFAASSSTAAQNAVYGATNTAGLTNITAIQNASNPAETGIMWGTSPSFPSTSPFDIYLSNLNTYIQGGNYPLGSGDWINGLHLW